MAGRPKRRRKMRRLKNKKKFQDYYRGPSDSGFQIGSSGIVLIAAALGYWMYQQKKNQQVEVIVLNPEEDLF